MKSSILKFRNWFFGNPDEKPYEYKPTPPSKFKHKSYIPNLGFNNKEEIYRLDDSIKVKAEIIKGKDIKAGDVIIQNNESFVVTLASEGFGAGGEFGNYIHIEGYNPASFSVGAKKMKKFWTFRACPVIKLIDYV